MANTFHIRAMQEKDLRAVVHLQRLSLGEGSIPRSEEFWRWKHQHNPFGPSLVLLAFDDELLIGLRAFMRWDWHMDDQVFRCLRAVDTATHPEYQGKGVFKKLTLELIDQAKAGGYEFIFNTPNEKSLPGYLKMGWKTIGNLPVRLKLGVFSALWRHAKTLPSPPRDFELQRVDWQALGKRMETSKPDSFLHTKPSAALWEWRYAKIPDIEYFGGLFEEVGWIWIVGRIKDSLGRRELRIVELYGTDHSLGRKKLTELISHYQPAFVSIADQKGAHFSKKPGFKWAIGPKVTLRELNAVPPKAEDLNHWNASLGDLELF
jgi:GNAT superfamily N-acetyltransferase